MCAAERVQSRWVKGKDCLASAGADWCYPVQSTGMLIDLYGIFDWNVRMRGFGNEYHGQM